MTRTATALKALTLKSGAAAIAAAALSGTALAGDFTTQRVEFLSGGETVVGTLYVPAGAKKPRPAVLVSGPQTNHKDMVPATYAAKLAADGFVALAFDPRGFGESAGAVRDFENPATKVEDLRNALTFLQARPEVVPGSVGMLGICSGAGYAAKAAAGNAEVKALVTIAGFYHDPAVFKAWLGDKYDARVELGRAARAKYEATGVVDFMTNVSTDPDAELAMPGMEAYEYYGTARNTGARWANRSATMFFEPFLQFNSIDSGREVGAATLVIHSDAALVPEGAKRFHASLPGKKALYWMDTRQHIDFYDVTPVVDGAAKGASAWFAENLAATRTAAR